jgi:soluble lytic murein transglycosylase-like protein
MGVMRLLFCLIAVLSAIAQTPDPMQSSIEKQKMAAAQQRESVRKQVVGLKLWLPPARDDPPEIQPVASILDCDVVPEERLSPMIEAVAKGQELDPKLLRAVMRQESGFHPCAVSSKGAKGLMQLMPSTAADLGVRDILDAEQNVQGGARYLKQLLDRYKGDLSQALAAYNAGPVVVDAGNGVPNIQETKDYVNSILKTMGVTRTVPPKIPMPKPIEN